MSPIGRPDNPTVRDAGYNDNNIKAQYSVRRIAGNVQANLHKFNIIEETLLPKRKMPTQKFRCAISRIKYDKDKLYKLFSNFNKGYDLLVR